MISKGFYSPFSWTILQAEIFKKANSEMKNMCRKLVSQLPSTAEVAATGLGKGIEFGAFSGDTLAVHHLKSQVQV